MDRIITVNVVSSGFNEYGEQEDTKTPYRCWARVYDLDREAQALEGSIRDSGRRDWAIRWLSQIASQPATGLEVVDDGVTWTVLSYFELTRNGNRPDLRRRMMRIEGGRGNI